MDYWYKTLGKHYYIEVFKMAREIFGENVKLFYNDCNEGNKEKQKIITTAINHIKEYEIQNGIRLIDGFGMQSHYWGSEDESREHMDNLYLYNTVSRSLSSASRREPLSCPIYRFFPGSQYPLRNI